MIKDSHIIESWQSTMDILAEIFNVPAALIMTLTDGHLEVFVSSKTDENPYVKGDKELFDGSGLYCERVIKTNSKLLVPNALSDDEWKSNPDIKLGMISYLGFPIVWPNGKPFGTICVLDKKENAYSSVFIKLLEKLKQHIELDLKLMNKEIETRKKNEELEKALSEVRTLQGIIPICSYCHSIRDDEGAWDNLLAYIHEHTNAQFSHGICPKCLPKARIEACLDEK